MGCFLRPQYLLIENKRPGYGLLTYFLTAIYKVFSIGGYFSSENTAFFNFSKTILNQETSINYQLEVIMNPSEIIDQLKRKLSTNEHVIIPANIKNLYYFKGFMKKDWEHYFIISGYNKNTDLYTIKDNLHISADNMSYNYCDFVMQPHDLQNIIDQYFQYYINNGLYISNPFNGENQYWFLTLDMDGQYVQLNRSELSVKIIFYYQNLVLENLRHSNYLSDMDARHLSLLRIQSLHKDVLVINRCIRHYMKDINMHIASLKILFIMIGNFDQSASEDLINQLGNYHKSVTFFRNKLFVKCVSGTPLSDSEWKHVCDFLQDEFKKLHLTIALHLEKLNVEGSYGKNF